MRDTDIVSNSEATPFLRMGEQSGVCGVGLWGMNTFPSKEIDAESNQLITGVKQSRSQVVEQS